MLESKLEINVAWKQDHFPEQSETKCVATQESKRMNGTEKKKNISIFTLEAVR